MKKHTKILSAFLAIILFMGCISQAAIIPSFAATAERSIPAAAQKNTTGIYSTPADRVANMDFYASKYGYEIYADPVTGEVAYVEIANPENILLTNPYDVGSMPTTISDELLSQIIITFSEKTSTSNTKQVLTSYKDAAKRNQISIARIQDGIRVSYTIGDLNKRSLVPHWILKESFEEKILTPLQTLYDAGELNEDEAFTFESVSSYYQMYGRKKTDFDETYNKWKKTYRVLEDPNVIIYVVKENADSHWLSQFHNLIKDHCSDTYNFDELDMDHEATGYEEVREEKPVFKAALEYTLTEDGMRMRLPCNSLQYNMATYTLESIQVLPYMGAGNTRYEGYNFYPDGAGSLFDFDQTVTVPAQIYGLDYAYHQISGATYQKAIRMPVYGSVATEVIHTYVDADGNTRQVSDFVRSKESLETAVDKDGKKLYSVTGTTTYKRGYLAILEAGESMGSLTTDQLGSRARYATITPSFNPKPKDTYELDAVVSASSSSNEWTVVSERKYTGDIRILFQMLTDADVGSTKKIAARARGTDYLYYEASWLGMAEAYRDYLVSNGTLTKLNADDLKQNIPLYMEVFGALKTQKTVATIPMQVMTPLTTFEDISTIYHFLSSNGVSNVNFKMTGFANGGMYSTIPASLKWESKVGGASGFRDLIYEAQEIEANDENAAVGLYADFDFAYSQTNTWFDDLDLKKDAVKTIDNRYSSKRVYSATRQTYVSFYQLAISPSRYSKFYNKLLGNLEQYDLQSLSLSTLGYALNSDFDEDDPYNREDSKKYTKKALAEFADQYMVMTDYGNAYSWAYVDHIVNADIDSSRYSKASCSVPFLGTVLHGYLQFAGPSLNQEGDPNYMIMKSIENGASLYFILSYQNTSELKEDSNLSSYYSVDYNIWKEDLLTYYKTLNDLMYDVQSKVIIDHKFLNEKDGYQTVRLLDEKELAAQIDQEIADALEQARTEAEKAELDEKAVLAEASVYIRNAEESVQTLLAEMKAKNAVLQAAYADLLTASSFPPRPTDAASKLQERVDAFYEAAVTAYRAYNDLVAVYTKLQAVYQTVPEQLELLRSRLEGTDMEYRYTSALEIATAFLEDETVRQEADELMMVAEGQTYGEAIFELYTTKLAGLNSNVYYKAVTKPTEKQFLDACVVQAEPDENDDPSTDVQNEATKLNNNKVVIVSYGDVNSKQIKTYYKSFILNFNNYMVRTVYNGLEYTIPAYGYAVIYH